MCSLCWHLPSHPGTNKKYIIKVNNSKIFWALLMSLICCIPAGIPHISFLKQPEELKREVHAAPHFAYQPSSCWQMLDLIKTAAPRQDRGGSPPGQDQSWDNLPGNEKSTIVCRKYQNHHNHLSHGDLYLRSSSPRTSAATFTTFQTMLVPSTRLCRSKQHKPPEALGLFLPCLRKVGFQSGKIRKQLMLYCCYQNPEGSLGQEVKPWCLLSR